MFVIQNCYNDKVVEILTREKSGKACLVFSHGLGDFCLFLPLFEELQKQFPDWNLSIGLRKDRNYNIYPNIKIINGTYGALDGEFDILFGIQYPEPPRDDYELRYWLDKKIPNIKNITKPYLCNLMEIGLKDFEWKPYKLETYSIKEKKIGIHFSGYTSTIKKDLHDEDIARSIWNEIKFLGFEPIEIQMVPSYVENSNKFDFIGDNTLRHLEPNIKRMSDEISKCKYFLGCDSGPLYLAGTILGFDKVIGLERNRKFNKVLPIPIQIINVDNYKEMDVIRALYNKEK